MNRIVAAPPFNYPNITPLWLHCWVSEKNTINGWSAGDSIGFGRYNGYHWALSSDVVYHEYGHCVIYDVYGDDWIGDWWDYHDEEDEAMDEGFADYFACTINDDPVQGEDVGVNRNLQNLLKYPDDMVWEAHHDGQIIGGCVWDLRGYIGEYVGDSLFFLALQITPQAHNFEEYFENVLLADDDDNDLSNGTPHCYWVRKAFQNHGIGMSYQLWAYETVDQGVKGYFSSLALDQSRTPHISYYDAINKDLRYAVRLGSNNWNKITVDSGGDVGKWTAIGLETDGAPHIGYHDATNFIAKHAWWNGVNWSTEPTIPLPFGGLYVAGTVNSNDIPLGCFYSTYENPPEYPGKDLVYVEKIKGYWSATPVDVAGVVGQWNSLALDRDGEPHIAYYDSTNSRLKHAWRDGGLWFTEVVDNSGNVGCWTGIAVDNSGNIHISYMHLGSWSPPDNYLKYAVKHNGTWHIESINPGGNCGASTDIAIDVDGCPAISFYHYAKQLKVAKRLGPNNWLVQTVDDVGIPGYLGTSIIIDSQGLVHLTYGGHGANEDQLRYATGKRLPVGEPTFGGGRLAGVQEAGLRKPMIAPCLSLHPNPASGSVVISYQLNTSAPIQISIYDAAGRKLKSWVNVDAKAGHHLFRWDVRDETGRPLPAGIYFCCLHSEGYSETKKLILLH